MKTRTVVGPILFVAATFIAACCGDHSSLQEQLAERNQQLNDARASAAAWKKNANLRDEDAKREKARADELDARMKKVSEVVERIRALDGRTGATIASAIETASVKPSSAAEPYERQQITPTNAAAVNAPQLSEGTLGSTVVIRHFCEQKWATNFEMRSYCEDQQNEAVGKLKTRSASSVGMSAGDFDSVRSACAAKWPDNFEMRDYCEEQQIDAYRKLQR